MTDTPRNALDRKGRYTCTLYSGNRGPDWLITPRQRAAGGHLCARAPSQIALEACFDLTRVNTGLGLRTSTGSNCTLSRGAGRLGRGRLLAPGAGTAWSGRLARCA